MVRMVIDPEYLNKVKVIKQVAWIFYPFHNQDMQRHTFVLIFENLRQAPDNKVKIFDHIGKLTTKQSMLDKVTEDMKSIGFINYDGEYWHFDDTLFRNIERFEQTITFERAR